MQWKCARRTSTLTLGGVGVLFVGILAASGSAAFAASAAAQVASVSTNVTGALPKLHNGAVPLPALSHRMKGLSPLSLAQPHSHPLEHEGGPTFHGMTDGAHGPAIGALNLSANWSGLVNAGSGAVFTAVAGDWVVPTVPVSASDEASATWIGIDGFQTQTLIQTGTDQLSGPGGTQYLPWIELLPGPEEIIGDASGPAPVQPGDGMTASIIETSPGLWTIDLKDTTQNWTYSKAFPYNTPGTSAEWIEEAPMVNGNLATLPDYGSTTFSNLSPVGAAAQLIPVDMATQSGAIISYPADVNLTTDSFSVFYGSPSPSVNSVSPDQGSTSGGTTVTIGGGFVTGVTSVKFGGASAPFIADIADGAVIASAPPHAAGTVDVTVTTPGGTSQVTAADHFTYVALPPPPPPPPHGYWLVGSDGGIFTFGSAQFYGSTGNLRLQRPVVGITPTRDRGGYWLVASDGGIFSFGDSGFYGSIPGVGLHPAGSGLPNSLRAPIVGMVPSSDGGGYFMVASDGGVFAFGDAKFAGSCPGIGGCAGSAVAVMPDASGNGYWLVTSSGAVYAFGDAPYYGAPGAQSVPVTSAVRTPDGRGYWILFANGAIASYGDAANYSAPVGALGGLNPATAIFATADGDGYWVASASGGVYPYGDAPNDGSMAGTRLNGPVIAGTGW